MEEIRTVASVGCGVIGSSFALRFAMAGYQVYAYNRSEKGSRLAEKRIRESLDTLREKAGIGERQAGEILDRIIFTQSVHEAVQEAQLIQESLPECYEIKWKGIEEIERYCPKDSIIASSTSGLPISQISKYARYPERFLGAHPYNPPHLIPLIEITRGGQVPDAIVAWAVRFYRQIGNEPVVLKKEVPGFICNRLQMALYREACDLVMNGVCTVEDVDRAMVSGPGIRWAVMGPSLLFELGGGEGGVSGLMKSLDSSFSLWFKTMATWGQFPAEWPGIVQKGVDEELAHRDPAEGVDREGLRAYRDAMLLEILKLHGRLRPAP